MYNKEKFSELLIKAQGDRSLNKYAEDSYVDSGYLSRIINGKRTAPPSPDIIRRLADHAQNNISYYDLMETAGYITKEERLLVENPTQEIKEKIMKYIDSDFRDEFINGYLNEIKCTKQDSEKVFEALQRLGIYDFYNRTVPIKDRITIQKELMNEKANDNIPNVIPIGDVVRIPVLGRIPAGMPIEAAENIIDYVEVPKAEVSNGEYFYLQVIGDSMIGSRIYEGDRVLIRKQSDIESGEIAVVRTNGYDATLKRVKKVDGQVILYPDNPNYEPIIIDSKDAIIIGKVIKVEFDPNKK